MDPLGSAPGCSQPSSEQPFGVLGLCLEPSSERSGRGSAQLDPLESQPNPAGALQGLLVKIHLKPQHFISSGGTMQLLGLGWAVAAAELAASWHLLAPSPALAVPPGQGWTLLRRSHTDQRALPTGFWSHLWGCHPTGALLGPSPPHGSSRVQSRCYVCPVIPSLKKTPNNIRGSSNFN